MSAAEVRQDLTWTLNDDPDPMRVSHVAKVPGNRYTIRPSSYSFGKFVATDEYDWKCIESSLDAAKAACAARRQSPTS